MDSKDKDKEIKEIYGSILDLYNKHMACSKYPYMEVLHDRADNSDLRRKYKLLTGKECDIPNGDL